MQNRHKKVVIIVALIALFYALQYVGTAVHYGCQDPAEDCPPPFYLGGEVLFRLLAQPPWLDGIVTR